MPDIMEIGPAPCDESCAQVGTENYARRARAECRAFINQIVRVLGNPPEGASLCIRSSSHDFGTYYEVAVKVRDIPDACAYRLAVDYAYLCESSAPAEWDETARAELAAAGFSVTEGHACS